MNCKTTWGKESGEVHTCPNCNGDLTPTGIDLEQWKSFSDEVKTQKKWSNMKMKCMSCNKEMDVGYIQVPTVRLAWSPEKKKKSMFARVNWQVDSDEIPLGKYNYFTGSKVTAYRC